MKHWFLGGLVVMMGIVGAAATNVSTSLLAFPFSLGLHADPLVIPLSRMPLTANYNYGVVNNLGAPRVMLGGLESAQGKELDCNLASIYGIVVVAEDSTQVPALPVTLKVHEERDLPVGSPYTREQALVATLWCLIMEARGSDKVPLVVKVDAKDPALTRYAGEFVAEGVGLKRGAIPGSELRRDPRGVLNVVFDPQRHHPREVTKPHGSPPTLVFVPVRIGEEGVMILVPCWTDSTRILSGPWMALPLAMMTFSLKEGENANSLHGSSFNARNEGAGHRVSLSRWSTDAQPLTPEDRLLLAAACHATLLSMNPTEAEPFEVSLGVSAKDLDAWKFLAADGWSLARPETIDPEWTRTFTNVPKSIAGFHLEPSETGGFVLTADKAAE